MDSGIVNIYNKKYSYADLSRDIKRLSGYYKDIISTGILGKTSDGNNIYCIRLGNDKSERKVIIQSAMHAREWLNTQLLMMMTERCLRFYYSARFEGIKYNELFDKVCFYIIPMLNPDGVNISQYGLKRISNNILKRKVRQIGRGRYRRWKANAEGVDLNRNYETGFTNNCLRGASECSGDFPYSEKETKAFVKLVDGVKPLAVINYHETGRLIYYKEFNKLTKLIKAETGYCCKYDSGANGSLGDWLSMKNTAWVTIETCIGRAPVNHLQLYREWKLHKNMIQKIAKLYIDV